MTTNKVSDESKDKAYFTITPQLVWALSKDPYDFTLWNVIKMIAGDSGECYLSTEDLATLAMMSTGKVSQCRKRLIEHGLLEGEIRRDPGYPQPVWHLSIPDLWERNLKWRQEIGDDLKKRIELKGMQKSLHQMKASPDEEGITPGEEGGPSDEEGITPGETKEIQKEIQTEIQKEEPSDAPQKSKADPLLFEKERETAAARAEAGGNWADAGEDRLPQFGLFCLYDKRNKAPPKQGTKQHRQQCDKVAEALRSYGYQQAAPELVEKAAEIHCQRKGQWVNVFYKSFVPDFGEALQDAEYFMEHGCLPDDQKGAKHGDAHQRDRGRIAQGAVRREVATEEEARAILGDRYGGP